MTIIFDLSQMWYKAYNSLDLFISHVKIKCNIKVKC